MRFDCPHEKWAECFIDVPDEWLGLHSQRYQEAGELVASKGLRGSTADFVRNLTILDHWNLPGLPANNPPGWDILQTPLLLIGWVNAVVTPSFLACFALPKNSSAPSSLTRKGTTVEPTELTET